MLPRKIIRKQIGQRLCQARIAAGFSTPEEFCQVAKILTEAYLNHENGVSQIKYSDLIKYSALLHVPIDFLLGISKS